MIWHQVVAGVAWVKQLLVMWTSTRWRVGMGRVPGARAVASILTLSLAPSGQLLRVLSLPPPAARPSGPPANGPRACI